MLDKKFRIKFTTNSLDTRIPVVATSLRNLIDTLQFSYENKVPARVGRVTKPTEFSTNCMQEILIIDIYCLQDCYEILVKVLEALPLTCFMYKPYIKRNIYRIFVNSEYQLSKHITLVNSFVNLLNKTAIALNLINGIGCFRVSKNEYKFAKIYFIDSYCKKYSFFIKEGTKILELDK